jgi:hypothetical protein
MSLVVGQLLGKGDRDRVGLMHHQPHICRRTLFVFLFCRPKWNLQIVPLSPQLGLERAVFPDNSDHEDPTVMQKR